MRWETRLVLAITGATVALAHSGALDGRSFVQAVLVVVGSVLALAAFADVWDED